MPFFQVRHLAGRLDRGDELRLECRRVLHLRGARAAVRQIRPADGRRGRTPGDNHSRPGHGGPGLQLGLRHQPGCPEPGGRGALRCARLHRQQRRGQGPHRRPELPRVHGGPRSGRAGGGSGRQAGSTFKAFMLAALIKAGYSPTSVFPAPPEVVLPHGNQNGTPWKVTNFEHESTAPTMSLVRRHRGLHQHGLRPGGRPFRGVHPRFHGRSSRDRSGRAPGAYPSQVLGTADVSPRKWPRRTPHSRTADLPRSSAGTSVKTANGTPLPLPVQPVSRSC